MIQQKLADLVIIGVRYESVGSYQRIGAVQVSNALSRLIVPGEIARRETIVEAILNYRTVVTARWNGFRLEGDRVMVFRKGNDYFIRTDGSPTTSDNLGSLPRF